MTLLINYYKIFIQPEVSNFIYKIVYSNFKT